MAKTPKSEYKQLHLVMDPSLVIEAQVKCTRESLVLSRVVEQLLDMWMKGKVKLPV